MKLLSNKKLNELRGKAMVGKLNLHEMTSVFDHITALELKLDLADLDDMLGPEGWRHYVGQPEK